MKLTIVLTVLSAVGGLSAPPTSVTTFQTKVFDDNFSTFNSSNWFAGMTDGWQGPWAQPPLPAPYTASGCGNLSNSNCFDAEYDDPAQASYGSGGVTFTATRSSAESSLGYSMKSAALTSAKKTFCPSNGCYIQLSAKLSDMTTGGWPAFWFPPSQNRGAEIDWFEGGFTGISANHSWTFTNQANGVQRAFDAGDLTTGFHTYGFEYKPGVSLKVALDNVVRATIISNVPNATDYVFVMGHQFGNANSCGWRTCFSSSTPNGLQMQIKQIQVYH